MPRVAPGANEVQGHRVASRPEQGDSPEGGFWVTRRLGQPSAAEFVRAGWVSTWPLRSPLSARHGFSRARAVWTTLLIKGSSHPDGEVVSVVLAWRMRIAVLWLVVVGFMAALLDSVLSGTKRLRELMAGQYWARTPAALPCRSAR